ncbi:DUF4142 domain-containing protein [Streptomyces sp. NPDC058239]|uniref:DUF4142 domain-containing protein n=1 Tax=Streptomyces sp. NPDC058239 TaxID=3346395 RepID=UPI0036E44552
MAAATMPAALAGISAPSAFAVAAATDDAPFLKAIHQGNLAEIAAGQDAGKNATTACAKTVGATLVRDHRKLDADVKALAGKLHVTLTAGPSPAQEQALAAVRAKAGTSAYDVAWLNTEATGHVETLALIDQKWERGATPWSRRPPPGGPPRGGETPGTAPGL